MTLPRTLSQLLKGRRPGTFFTRHRFESTTRHVDSTSSRSSSASLAQKSSKLSSSNVVDDAKSKYEVGQKLHGFTVQKTQDVPEMALHATFLQHDVTGAEYLHVTRADHNNVFGVAFRTPPSDSTGVAHILEHTVLCGSEKYPVRDPFFNMLNRSLSTFMNAMTSSDWTMYPFSTLNPKDFKNLMNVYLDAAFFPRLRNVDFRQEGIRLEAQDPKDSSSPIVFKGVVFNEMKGVFSNPENMFGRKIQNYLLPTGTYSHESGGDPLYIPDLTWEQLRQFHKSYYHPSNCRFYTYGDMPLESHLESIQEKVLRKFQKSRPDSMVQPEPRWTSPKEVTIEGPINPLAPPDQQSTVSVSYLLPEVLDPFENFCMSVVAKLLVSGPKAPFYQSLLQSGLGADYAPGTGFDGSIREGVFGIGLKNIKEENVRTVIETISSTIDRVVDSGFDMERVDAILHEIELYLKHQTTSFGLHAFFGLMSSWNHDADPIQHLQVSKVVERFRQTLKEDPHFLQKKVKEYLQDNPHNLTLIMQPNANYEELIKGKEAELLAAKTKDVDEARREELAKEAKELLEEQNKKPDVSVLPTLKISDIEKSLPGSDIERIQFNHTPVLCVRAPTNGVTYFRSMISTEKLDEALLPYVPLFCTIATRMGAGDMDYRQLSQKIESKTGGLSVSDHASHYFASTDKFEQGIVLGSYCLDRNIPEMFGLWKDIFNRIRLDDMEQFGVLVKQVAADLASGLADSGHAYAMAYSAASLRPAGKLREEWNGISQVHLMKDVGESTDLTPTLAKMRAIASHLLSNGRMRCSLNATPDTMHGAQEELQNFLETISHSPEDQHLVTDQTFTPSSKETHLTFPFAVHYASRSYPIPSFSEDEYASSRLLAKILSSKFLHREIREKGGAYGGGARVSHDGLFQFYSYRDPKNLETFEAFDKSIDWAVKGEFSLQDIDEAKLSVFSEVDKPVAPGDKGKREFIFHVNDELFQEHRQRLLKVDKDQLVDTARTFLKDAKTVVSTMLGPPNELMEKKGWTVKPGAGDKEPVRPCSRS